MIIREFIDFENMNLKDVIYLGDFPPWCDYPDKVQEMINSLPNKDTLNHIFTNNKWKGCFGGCSFITLKYLELIQEKFNMFSLIPYLQLHREYLEYYVVLLVIQFYIIRVFVLNYNILLFINLNSIIWIKLQNITLLINL